MGITKFNRKIDNMTTKTLKQRANSIRKSLQDVKLKQDKEMTLDKNIKDKEIIGPTESRLGDRKRERITDKTKTNV
jgi:hypothetical protein